MSMEQKLSVHCVGSLLLGLLTTVFSCKVYVALNVRMFVYDELEINWKKNEMGGAYSTQDIRNLYKILVGRPEGERPLGRRRRRWKDNIRIDFREIGWEGVDWIQVAQDREK
jgi:hypothetical protein